MVLFRARRRRSKAERPKRTLLSSYRRCAFEQMEQRRLLASDIMVGVAYYEDDSGQDEIGDHFELTFDGGVAGTQLAQITIDTDKVGDGLTIGDVLFDTAPGGLGAFEAVGLSIIDQTGIDSVNVDVDDGGTLLTMTFTGFDPGEKLIFTVDVDEQGFLGANAVAEGNEFEGSQLAATFTAPHYFAADGSDIFIDGYDAKLTGSGLDLPPDDYVPPGTSPYPVRTAGAIFSLTQQPLPITIAGTVYEDFNLNNFQDPGDDGISGVTLSLLEFDGSGYIPTGKTAVTNALGEYLFDDVLPGQYRIQETQPAGYFSVGATAGNVAGVITGTVTNEDVISDISLLGGDDSIENDFAEALPGQLHGNVYHDVDNDGIFDPGETGIDGVTIEIQYLPASGTTPAPITVETMADGSWWAMGLRPGEYEIREIQPTGYYDGLDAAGTAGGVAHNPGDEVTGVFLHSGQIGEEYNFGELVPASISGHVYADDDNDGVFDAAEEPIAGVTVMLLGATGTPTGDTTTTDADGFYSFDGLRPGVYGVAEMQPVGYFDGIDAPGTAGGTAQNPGDQITGAVLGSAVHAMNYDFGEIRPASISGHVYADDDNDGIFDAAEVGIAGVTLTLLDAAGVSTGVTTTTDADGYYFFDGLKPGVHGVAEAQPTGFFDGIDAPGSAGGTALNPGDQITGAVLAPAMNAVNYDFGEIRPASISGHVYADDDNDGVFDAAEVGIAGVTLTLLDSSGVATGVTTITDSSGFYFFDGLEPGVYGVAEAQPTGFFDGLDTPGSAGGTALNPGDQITGAVLAPGMNAVNYDFGEIRPASISGHVYADDDNDGVFDAGEVGIAGVTLTLLDSSGAPTGVTTTTDASGFYVFDGIEPGIHGIAEAQPTGFFDGLDTAGSAGGAALNPGDQITGAVLGPGEHAVNYDFGEIRPASISGHVYSDNNDNGVFEPGETGIADVELELLDASNTPTGITTVTDANGFYAFLTLKPGAYGIRETQPAGYLDGTDAAGTAGGTAENPGDRITGAVLGPGSNGEDYDFGELPPASIGGYVYADDNDNGLFEAGETGIAGVTLELLDAGGNPTGITTTTASDGSYRFGNLFPGVYGVAETQPAGYFDGTDTPGTAGGVAKNPGDLITDAVLNVGVDAQNYNFGELRPASISGFVFQDGDTVLTDDPTSIEPEKIRDGLHTPDDTPIAGVTLRLADASGEPVMDGSGQPVTTVTDQNGFYSFTNLRPGIYTVYQEHPQGYVDSLDTAGSTGGVAFNSGSTNGPQILAHDPKNDALALIVVTAGIESRDNNFSELAVAPPPPPPPPPPEIPPYPFFLLTPGPAPPPITSLFSVRTPTPVPVPTPFAVPPPRPVFFGGNVFLVAPYTWHLSIIDAGDPRGPNGDSDLVVQNASTQFNVSTWSGIDLDQGRWRLSGTNAVSRSGESYPLEIAQHIFGIHNAIGVTGDFNGDGVTEIGVFVAGEWFLDLNGNGVWDTDDLWAKLGEEGDLPITGDWDGDGKTDIGIFGPEWIGDPRAIAAEPGLPDADNRLTGPHKNLPPRPHEATIGQRTMKQAADGKMRADLIDHVFQYGQSGDKPVTGDWNGDGMDSIGVFRKGRWLLDADGDGRLTAADIGFVYGQDGDWPVVGDFNGDGFDQVGVFRNGTWTIDSNGDRVLDAHDQVFHLGGPGDQPVVGDWDGDGRDEIGLYGQYYGTSSGL